VALICFLVTDPQWPERRLALHFALGLRANQPPLATYGPGEVAGFVDGTTPSPPQ
jgi:hypothetical protein